MDESRFDRLARLYGVATTRRAGLGALLAAAALGAGAVAKDDSGRRRRAGAQGPCGNGSRKDNLCARDGDCCTGICRTGLKNRDGKGRCRCVRKGKACTEDRNCCGGRTCTGKICVDGGNGPTPTPVPRDCIVCASGCPYTSVAAAIAGEPADATITIDDGTYDEDLLISANVTLANCEGSAPVLRNATAGRRTILFDSSALPYPRLTIDSVTITSSSGVGNDGGGIAGPFILELVGTALVTGCQAADGGGIQVGDCSLGGCDFTRFGTLTMSDSASVSGNVATDEGGGVYLDSYGTIVIGGSAAVSDNEASLGGGVHMKGLNSLTMNDTSVIEGNSATLRGGGVNGVGPSTLTGASSIRNNTCGVAGGGSGGGIAGGHPVTLSDTASITGNSVSGNGGGIFNEGNLITVAAGTSISNNSATGTGGGIQGDSGTTYSGPTGIVINNTPDNCAGGTFSC
jgi:hypothetical protein